MTDQQAPEFEEPAPPGAEPPLPTPESMQSTAPPPPPPVEPVPPATVSSGGDGGNRNLIILGFAVVIGLIAIVLGLQGGIIGGAGSSPEPSPSPAASPSAEPSASAEPSPSPSPALPLASTLILGGPPECPKRPFCALGLKETYGLEFKEFRALDVGGPITVEAIKGGQIDVGLLFTSDPAIAVNGFVALVDDKGLQNADNIVPVVRQGVLDTSPAVKDLIDPWMAKLTQEQLLDLNKRVGVDQQDPKTVVGEWLAANGLQTGTGGAGVTVKIGSFNFGESETLGELLAQILEANGFSVERKFNLGNREIVFPALQSGEIDLVAEYAASVLEYVNEGAGEATGDPAATTAKLSERLAPRGLVALAYAPATDQNTFVVTSETASKYRLTKLSDLAAPSP
ncbi:MAG TPA: glycine betaine ABC transporter substrate-binding protein [Candidatus Limnocylindrales bacterium]|nr:glycine betaine ABC transporter substrate-binding protein [Candidatus Limnocylindrales bacterium]